MTAGGERHEGLFDDFILTDDDLGEFAFERRGCLDRLFAGHGTHSSSLRGDGAGLATHQC